VDALLDALLAPASQTAPAPSSAREPLVDKREMSWLFAVSPSTIDRLARTGMPFVPVGEVRPYDVDACRVWMAEQGQRPAAQAATDAPSSSRGREPIGLCSVSYFDLFRASTVSIRRHVKVQQAATAFEPAFREYFQQLRKTRVQVKTADRVGSFRASAARRRSQQPRPGRVTAGPGKA